MVAPTGKRPGQGRTGQGAGVGKPGYCSICAWPGAQFVNARRAEDPDHFLYPDFKALANQMDPNWRVPSKPTWYTHCEHITSPLITQVEKARANPVVVPKTTEGALEAIRDLGMQNVMEAPETITVDHVIKASAELAKAKTGTKSLVVVLAQLLGGGARPAIEGEWHEVPQLETEEELNA